MDIIGDLQSLQFETFLTKQELRLCNLRTISHSLTLTACAQATFLVSVLRDARLIDLKHNNHAGEKEVQDGFLSVGIIGCGRFGRHLANSLLSFGEILPKNLKISTRRPELLMDLSSQGVVCTDNNAAVAGSVSILFLCCLPAQLRLVAADICDVLSTHTVVFSVVTAVPVLRLKRLLGSSNVLRPEMKTGSETMQCGWDVSQGVVSAMELVDVIERTCPLSYNKPDSVVVTRERFAEVLVYAVANFVAQMQLSIKQKLTVINSLLLGQTKETHADSVFHCDDFDEILETGRAPVDLVQVATTVEEVTPVGCKLLSNPAVRQSFVDRYCDVFVQHSQWATKAATGPDCVTGAAARRKRIDSVIL